MQMPGHNPGKGLEDVDQGKELWRHTSGEILMERENQKFSKGEKDTKKKKKNFKKKSSLKLSNSHALPKFLAFCHDA